MRGRCSTLLLPNFILLGRCSTLTLWEVLARAWSPLGPSCFCVAGAEKRREGRGERRGEEREERRGKERTEEQRIEQKHGRNKKTNVDEKMEKSETGNTKRDTHFLLLVTSATRLAQALLVRLTTPFFKHV